MADLDPNALQKLRVVDLKKILGARGLSTSGLKADLVKRLREAVLEESKGEGGKNDEPSVPEGSTDEETWEGDATQEQEGSEKMQLGEPESEEDSRMEYMEDSDNDKTEMAKEVQESGQEAEEELNLWAEKEKQRQAEQKEEQKRHEEQMLEEQRKLAAEAEKQRINAEQEQMLRAKQERLHMEQLRQRQMEEEKLMLAKEQQKLLEEQKRQLAEAEKLRLAEQQQRLLAEEKEKLAEQQRMLAEEQRRLLAEEQQRLLAEEERQKEKELFQLQQQALIEKDEEQRNQTMLSLAPPASIPFPPGLHIPPPPTTAATAQPLSSSSQQIPQGLQLSHVLTVPSQPPASNHVQMHPPPPPPSLSTIGALPPPPPPALLVSSVQQRAPPAPMPPPPPPPNASISTASMSHPLAAMSMASLTSAGQISHFSQPPPQPLGGTMLAPSVPPPPPPPSVGTMLSTSIPPTVTGTMHTTSMPPPPGSGTMLSASMPPPPPGSGSIITSMPPPPGSGPILSTSMPPPPPVSGSMLASVQPMSISGTSAPGQSSQPTVATTASSEDSNMDSSMTTTNSALATSVSDGSGTEDAIKLPQAVEKVFALKTKRAQQLGVDPDSVITPTEKDVPSSGKTTPITLVSVDELDEDEDMEEEETTKKTKEARRRRKKKKKKQKQQHSTSKSNKSKEKREPKETSVDIDIEYVQDVLDPSDPLCNQFIRIFEKFKLNEPEKDKADAAQDALKEEALQNSAKLLDRKKPADLDDDDDDDEKDDEKKDEEKPKLSKRKLKKLSRMSVAELKQKVSRPELVEMHDVTAKDPVLLLHLKASRNTVPVPRHWCFKRKYLQGKRGIEKPAFELPDFIKRTGIMEMRQALQEKEDQKTMKAKMRERVRPKLGKIDIDYHKLHDAFFKWQTKPKMTIHGDLYYEGKEFETRLKEKKPGDLSDDLRVALGMPTGPNANKCPPPWLIAMQRYGPPPSYPNLKIPGLNAPIPEGCSFGYHAGGWGKPPVDEMGRPLYGDVFGTQAADNLPQIPEEEIDHTLWGELESESSEEDEDEEEEDEDEEEQKGEDETGLVTPAEGLITPSGFSSIPAGMETPDMIELRKRKTEAEMEGGDTPALYTILPEKKSDRVGAAMMGSTHIYDLSAAIPASKVKAAGTTSVPPQGIEVALDPSELEMDTAAMAARYEQTMREQSQLEKEDLSDMVAEHAARQKTKRKRQQQDSGKAPKKYKEFKF